VAPPVATQQPVAQSLPPEVQQVLTSDRGETVVPVAPPAAVTPQPSAAAPATTALTGDPARAEPTRPEPSGGRPATSGSGASEDVSSAAPSAEISAEPQLPPTGESMIADFGGSRFPSKAIGLFSGTLTVEVAAIVGANGEIIEPVMISGSGIPDIDSHALNVVRHSVRFRPHTEIYEVRVFISFDHDERRLLYRTSDFITAPPTVGSGR